MKKALPGPSLLSYKQIIISPNFLKIKKEKSNKSSK